LVTLEDIELPTNNTRREYKLSLDDTKRIIQGLREFSKTTLKDGTVFYKKEELKNIFAFSLNGRRISEILNLRFEDINIDTRTFIIKSENAKGKKQLDFYIDDHLLEAIKSQAILRNVDLNSNSNKRVFKTSSVTTPLLNFQKMLQDMNLPKLRLHDIRHLLATTLVQIHCKIFFQRNYALFYLIKFRKNRIKRVSYIGINYFVPSVKECQPRK
jgi:integrase